MIKAIWTLCLISLLTPQVFGYDFYWEGNYSAQANYFNGVDLGNSSDGDKSYINHHLFLRPEIILYSGLSVKAGIDVINSGTDTLASGQRIGQILGGGLSGNGLTLDQDSVFRDRIIERNRSININEAYFEYAHTNGTLRLGRFPLHFGLGAFYNKGHNLFDHWFTNRDGVSYNFKFGNLHFRPMFSFISDSLDTNNGRIFEYGLEFHFKVEDTGLDLGAMILQRSISGGANVNTRLGAASGSATPLFFNLFYKRDQKRYFYGFEGMFQSGDVGEDASGNEVSLKGFGLAAEAEYRFKKWDFGIKTGYASGDDPSASSYSAVAFNRNYDLGLILFNHPLGTGTYDPTQTNPRGRLSGRSATDFVASETADTDSISNTIYLAPSATINFNDTWNLNTTLVFAWLEETNILASSEASKYLGTEVDLTLTYKPTENIICSGTLGMILPGEAFNGDGTLSSDSMFGSTFSIGISF